MKSLFVARNFGETRRPIYFIARALGLVAFSIDFEQLTIRRTFRDVLFFVTFLVLNSYLVIQTSLAPFDKERTIFDSALIEFILNLFIRLQELAVIGIPVVNYLNAYSYKRLIRMIVEVDDGLERLGYKHNFGREARSSALYLLVSVLIQIGCLCGTIISNPFQADYQTGHNAIVVITFFIANLVFITSTFYCCETLWVIVYRYHKLNVTFGLYFHTKPLSDGKQLLTIDDNETIKSFGVLYAKLGAIVLLFNWCFFTYILYVLGSAFGLNLVCFFSIAHVYLTREKVALADSSNSVMVAQLCLSIFYLMVILQFVFAGSLLHKKAKETAMLLHKAVIYNECSASVLEQLRSFSVQLSHQTPKASCYFFDIDWSFLLAMISTFATYLNILVQFDFMQIRAKRAGTNQTGLPLIGEE
uniref:Gustatory receptor n=1 Tax=Anopheles albimanus TaxID=7167 RepID=A0A182FRY5_ANOAL